MEVTVKKMNRFLMFKLPSAYLCGVKLKELDSFRAIVTVTHKWINKNPFQSMYFAVQSMAAELTTGAIVIKKIKESGNNISMLVTNHTGRFTKKAVGKILDAGGVFHRNASGALSLAYVADGRLLGYTEEHMNAWDCLAGQLLVAEAGGDDTGVAHSE